MLARWSSWGAVADVFDPSKENWTAEHTELRGLLTDEEWSAAERTTLNAHYTDPLVVRQMWRALGSLGFTTGSVLEPGSGAGTFIGMAPDGARMTGVELDPLTASISRALYPHAQVRTESFADTRIRTGSFDAAIGNVPFSDVKLHDPVHNPGHGAGRHSIHNHFIVKSLALTRPGGLVAVLTSHFTMDSQNPGARRAMAEMADLLGAVRLPNYAHQRAGGTDVVTDLLIFRRRLPGDPSQSPDWETTTGIEVDGLDLTVNTYFDDHPDFVLGRTGARNGMYGKPLLTVSGSLDGLEGDLAQALDQITFTARRNDLTMTAPEPVAGARSPGHPVTGEVAAEDLWAGSLVARPNGTFATVADGLLEPVKVPKNAASEMRALLELRDQASHLLTLEGATAEDTDEITAARASLSRDYRKYVGRWGPINRFTLRRTGRLDENGEDTYARIVPPAIRLLRTDPFGALVLALEQFDDVEQVATPAAIMSRRVVAPRPEVQGVDTPADLAKARLMLAPRGGRPA